MSEYFPKLLEEARKYLEEGNPFWCNSLLRPKSSDFRTYLIDNGFDVYSLYFQEYDENVYSPTSIQPEELKRISFERAKLRKEGFEDNELPSRL